MSSSQTTFPLKLQGGTDQDMRGRFIARMAWPPRADIVSSSPIGWGTRSLDQTCAHCTFSAEVGSACILFYGSDLCTLHIFLLNLLNQGLQPRAHAHCILFSAHIALHRYCTLLFSAQREIEAQGKPPTASCQICKVGNIDAGR